MFHQVLLHLILVCSTRSCGLCVFHHILCHVHVVFMCSTRSSVMFMWSSCVPPGPLSCSCGPRVFHKVLCHVHVVLLCSTRSSVMFMWSFCVPSGPLLKEMIKNMNTSIARGGNQTDQRTKLFMFSAVNIPTINFLQIV